jgi:hypothetical protein
LSPPRGPEVSDNEKHLPWGRTGFLSAK